MKFDINRFLTKTPHRENSYASDDLAVNFLLRHDNWNGAVGKPLNLKFAINAQEKNLLGLQEQLLDILAIIFFKCIYGGAINCRFSDQPYSIVESSTLGRQGTYDSTIEWIYSFLITKIKQTINDPNITYPALLEYYGINKLTLNNIIDNINNLETILMIYPNFNEQLFKEIEQQLPHNNKYSFEDNALPHNVNDILLQFISIYTKYTNINYELTADEDYQLNIGIGLKKTSTPLKYRSNVTSDSLVSDVSQDDITFWLNGKTLHQTLSLSLILNPELEDQFLANPHQLTIGDINVKDFIELFHGLGHSFIDHPGDSLLFLSRLNQEYQDAAEYLEDFSADMLSNLHTPFSSCMSTIVGGFTGGIFDEVETCIVEGREVHPVTPMPLDIKALQYLHTARCESFHQVFNIDGKHSPTLFNFNIPLNAIFTLFACNDSTLNLTEYDGIEQIKIDLEPGAGHFNIVGDNTFLFAYDTKVKNVHLPHNANIIIYTSYHDKHYIQLAEQATNIILRNENISMVTFDGYNSIYHKLYVETDDYCNPIAYDL